MQSIRPAGTQNMFKNLNSSSVVAGSSIHTISKAETSAFNIHTLTLNKIIQHLSCTLGYGPNKKYFSNYLLPNFPKNHYPAMIWQCLFQADQNLPCPGGGKATPANRIFLPHLTGILFHPPHYPMQNV